MVLNEMNFVDNYIIDIIISDYLCMVLFLVLVYNDISNFFIYVYFKWKRYVATKDNIFLICSAINKFQLIVHGVLINNTYCLL